MRGFLTSVHATVLGIPAGRPKSGPEFTNFGLTSLYFPNTI